jgi:hypothetical protein
MCAMPPGDDMSLLAMLDGDNSCHLCRHPLAAVDAFLSIVFTTAKNYLIPPLRLLQLIVVSNRQGWI